MNEKTRARDQLDLIHKITATLAEGSGRGWLFGGWGLDARIGRVTRDHGDIELWVDRHDAHHVQRLLMDAGATLLDTQPPEESAEYNWDGTWFSTGGLKGEKPEGPLAQAQELFNQFKATIDGVEEPLWVELPCAAILDCELVWFGVVSA